MCVCVSFKSGEEQNTPWSDRLWHLASTKPKYNFFYFSKLFFWVFFHLNLHFQPVRLLVEKSQPTVRTTWVSLVTSDTWRDTACPDCWDLATQLQFPPHFSFSHSSLGTSIKAVIVCPNKTKISRCFSKPLCFLTLKGACFAGLFTHPLSLWLLLYDPMSSPKLLQSFTVGKVQLWSLG